MTAGFAFSTANLNGRRVGFGPRPFRGTGFDPKTTLAVPTFRILVTRCTTLSRRSTAYQAMLPSFLHATVAIERGHRRLLIHAGLTQPQLLSNIEQSRKELLPGSQVATHGKCTDPSQARKSSSSFGHPRGLNRVPGVAIPAFGLEPIPFKRVQY